MIRTYQNSRVESAGRNVRLFRFDGVDVSVTMWRRKAYVNIYHHGELASEPLWVRVKVQGRLWDCDSRDLDELFRRHPKANLVQEPEPWAVIAEKDIQ
jgi:hypothetical protein